MNSRSHENAVNFLTPSQQVDHALYSTLVAALDCFRSRTLDNLDTAVSDGERLYFEKVLNEIDLAGAMLNDETRRPGPSRGKQATEAQNA